MKAVLQRVRQASVSVGGKTVGAIEDGRARLAAGQPVHAGGQPETGPAPREFQATMQVSSVNDGPVTFWLDSKNR